MTHATIDSVLQELTSMGSLSPEYFYKMIHRIPQAKVVERIPFILERVKDQVVLDIGCDSPVSPAIRASAKGYFGIDKSPGDWWQMDLDVHPPPLEGSVTLIVCGEVLEHLSSPGFFLRNLRAFYPDRTVIFTVPNAFAAASYRSVQRGIECVNKDHVSYYSWWTLTNLLTRHGYRIEEWYWYNGAPLTAEGLVMVVR